MSAKQLSILIPARNEMWLKNTVEDILKNSEADTEVLVGLDGQWANPSLIQHPKVTVVYFPESIGQRAMTNRLAKISRAKYVMKVDAHCSFDKGFDRKLIENMNDNWVVVPIMRNLHVFDWVCKKCKARKYQGPTPIECWNKECDSKEFERDVVWIGKESPQSTSYRFNTDLEFKYWGEYKKHQKGDLVDTMSLQGSCFMLTREKYWELDICDESWGSWGGQGTEISAKARLSGMEVKCNKKTWYAHLFRTQGGDFGFPYPNPGKDQKKAKNTLRETFLNNKWDRQIYPLSYIIESFYPIPDWSDEDIKKLKLKEMKVHRPGIYSIVNTDTKKIYIGSSTDIARRFIEHQVDLKNNKHENIHLQNSWNKYGEDKFVFNIEMFCSEEELIENEQLFIDKYKDLVGWEQMFNIQPIAHSSLGYKHTEDAKKKMGRNMRGENNPFYGKKHTKEALEKMNKFNKGHTPWNKGKEWSEEIKQKISEARMGEPAWNKGLTKETDNRLLELSKKMEGKPIYKGEHPKGMLNKKHTDETKKKISEAVIKSFENRNRDNNGRFVQSEKAIIFYTDNQLNLKIAHKVQNQLRKINLPIYSSSLKPMPHFGYNEHIKLERGREAYFRQILSCLERCRSEIVFFCEHDVLYHPSHFEFTPLEKNKFYFNTNVWKWNKEKSYGVKVNDCKQISGMVCYRDLALEFYREKIKQIEEGNFDKHFEPQKNRESFESEYPNIDIRHENNLTKNRWTPDEFKNKKFAEGWIESKSIKGWEDLII